MSLVTVVGLGPVSVRPSPLDYSVYTVLSIVQDQEMLTSPAKQSTRSGTFIFGVSERGLHDSTNS